MTDTRSFDPLWEEKYAAGHAQRYPWDAVVSFVFRYAPRDKPRNEIRILEVGCGTASNLWFAAREGFTVAGIDASPNAIATAKRRMDEEGLVADLRIGDFTTLPFAAATFDLVIDRGALTCCGAESMMKAIREIARVTKKGGYFLFTPYADTHSSFASGRIQADGTTGDITEGGVANTGQIYFVSRRQIPELLGEGWEIVSLTRREDVDIANAAVWIHAEWRVIAKRM